MRSIERLVWPFAGLVLAVAAVVLSLSLVTFNPESPPPPQGPLVTIASPTNGSSVPGVVVRVEGDSSGIVAGQVPENAPPWIYVVVRPIPSDPNQSWWVQPYPLIEVDGSWNADIYVGLDRDLPGTPFDICAIVSDERLPGGVYGGVSPPARSRDCVTVVRS